MSIFISSNKSNVESCSFKKTTTLIRVEFLQEVMILELIPYALDLSILLNNPS